MPGPFLRQSVRFSKKQLLLVVVLFAIAGSVIIWRSLAALPIAAQIEAERMLLPTGATVVSQSGASGGQAAKFTSNGVATGAVSLSGSASSIAVVAHGTKCHGWPSVAVSIDDTTVVPVTSTSTSSWATYSASRSIAAGTHTVRVIAGNTGKSGRCARDLYVDDVILYGTEPTPVPTVAFSASPTSITAGGASTLTWSSTNASSCTAAGAWSGTKAASGTASTGALSQTATYTLSCSGSGGTSTVANVTINVATTSSTSSCTPAYGSFSSTTWPSGCWRPYADTSPFNELIPSNPQLLANSANIVSFVTSLGAPTYFTAGAQDTAEDFTHPTYYSTSADPIYTVHCTKQWGTCPIEKAEVHIPSAAQPAGGTSCQTSSTPPDCHMTVVDQTSGWEYDMWQVTSKPSGGGTLNTSWGGKTMVTGDGLGSAGTAAGFGNMAGVIREQELAAGQINHALFMTVKCGTASYVYPAQSTDLNARCSNIGLPETNAASLGVRFQLNMTDDEINALPAPTWRKTIYKAMAHYGMYVGDNGGGSWGLQMESDTMYTSLGQPPLLFNLAKSNSWDSWYDSAIARTVYVGKMPDIDWTSKLRVIDPCVAHHTCQ